MFKDYNKYLSTSLKVYLFVLVIIFIMKVIGLDYFGLDINNPIMIKLEEVFSNLYVRDVFFLIELVFTQYLMISIVLKDNSKKLKIAIILSIPFTYVIEILKEKLVNYNLITILIEMLYLFLFVIIYNRINGKKYKFSVLLKRFFISISLNILFQLVSAITRYNYNVKYINNFVANLILNLDYIFLLLIAQKIIVRKGDVKLCISQEEVGLSLRKKINLKKSLLKLRKNFQNSISEFKKKSKQEKITIIIYLFLSLLWNTLTVLLILFVAFLNDTLIECLFILTSFWLSKSSFGKPFHFDSMIKCFIVSNLSYYLLNRLTTPLGISILVPIMLGVGLSYVTSKFVKKTYKPLYRGMDESLFEETILKVEEKDSIKYKICYEFYIEKVSDLSLSFKYNYSVPGIRKIRDRINQKIKKLN